MTSTTPFLACWRCRCSAFPWWAPTSVASTETRRRSCAHAGCSWAASIRFRATTIPSAPHHRSPGPSIRSNTLTLREKVWRYVICSFLFSTRSLPIRTPTVPLCGRHSPGSLRTMPAPGGSTASSSSATPSSSVLCWSKVRRRWMRTSQRRSGTTSTRALPSTPPREERGRRCRRQLRTFPCTCGPVTSCPPRCPPSQQPRAALCHLFSSLRRTPRVPRAALHSSTTANPSTLSSPPRSPLWSSPSLTGTTWHQ
mmetsp:Transcript_1630/g.5774  ORF Transcript_1630/g.5774 Transcript_1630/m.5774 type:complete len:254 (+) Transcript_1630:1808-2569(+)